MTYAQAVQYLYSLGNEIQTAKFDLVRITQVLDTLGNPHRSCRFIHVAGTNGKGSTSAMIESALRAAGVRTGLYTSPHLVEPTERIRIAGQPVTPEQFASAFDQVHAAAGNLRLDFHPTYFESVTAMAFLLFRDAQVDTTVLEVGMGGALDATNVVHPDLCVITPIDFDHQAFLGETIQQIAGEKAGILKPGVPAVFATQRPEAETVLIARAQGPYTLARQYPIADLQIDSQKSSFQVAGMQIVCPLAGEHQVENARTAALALQAFGCSPAGIAQTHWPGRLERVSTSPEILLDGAHNIAGAQALARYLRRFYSGRRIWIVFGVMRDKAVQEIAALLFPLAHKVILTRPANSRSMPPEMISIPGAILTHSVSDALLAARQASTPDDLILVTGSLYVVGEARAALVE
jgi:dihydrofolate synthase/folylpolyglutamate synthase